jgi:hypothetical protein
MGRPLNQFVLAMTYRRIGHAEQTAALLKDSIRLSEGMVESLQVDGAVPAVFAADRMTIQIYRREAKTLFIDSSQTMIPIPAP